MAKMKSAPRDGDKKVVGGGVGGGGSVQGAGKYCSNAMTVSTTSCDALNTRWPARCTLGHTWTPTASSQEKFTPFTRVTSAQVFACAAVSCARIGLPWACSSSLLSSSECGWLLPLVTFLALLLDRTPAPERSITEGMTARHTVADTHSECLQTCSSKANKLINIRMAGEI